MMIETIGLGAGSYPVPNEIIDCEDEEDYDCYMADIYHEEMMLGE